MSNLEPGPDSRSEQLRRLTEISRALTYTTEIDDVLELATGRAAELLAADRAVLMLSDDDDLLRVRASHGVDSDELERFREPLSETLISRLRGILDAAEPNCFLGVPLVVHGHVTGLLAVARSAETPCTEDDEWLLSAVADQVAVAVENSRLQDEVRREREARARVTAGAGEAEVASGRALATLSHDLRSPLNAIESYAELMEMEIFGSVTDRQRDALGRIRMSGRHLLAVLENVLEVTRLRAGVVRVNSRAVAAGTVIDEAVLMVEPAALLKDQTVEVASSPGIVVAADSDRLRQVLVNLLGNAIKYTPTGGTITIGTLSVSRGDPVTGIVVTDTGPGIPPDKIEAIFQPYYRLPETEADAPEGLGLGLAISRELIRHMGGDIDVESEPGHGCAFTVRLPVSDEQPASEQPA
ncbi:hypothetical protein BH23GEM10_BH23GEM10_16820 [soil metagenome]